MSGEEIRELAINGNHAAMAEFMRNTTNPCSVDEYGLTALMYAVWNGNTRMFINFCKRTDSTLLFITY